MHRRLPFLLALALALSLLLAAVPAQGFTIYYDTEYTGATEPSGDAPWLAASFETQEAGEVLMTLSASGLEAFEFVSKWLFSFNPDKDVDSLVFSWASGLWAEDVDTGADSQNAGGGYKFDIEVAYETSFWQWWERFAEGDVSSYLITGLDSLVAEDFYYDAYKGNGDSMLAAAHVQNIGWCGESGWVTGDADMTAVPEPGTLALASIGLLGAAFRRRRSRA
jgi:hypothetical protein